MQEKVLKLVPNAVTILATVLSCIALYILLFEQQLINSLYWALAAMLADVSDGYLARKLKATSKFGASLDTVTDILLYVIFVFAVIIRIFTPSDFINLALAIFVAASLYRLLRFQAQGFITTEQTLYYSGMPVYYNLIGLCLILKLQSLFMFPSSVVAGLLIISSGLMVSKIKSRKPNSVVSLIGVICLGLLVLTL